VAQEVRQIPAVKAFMVRYSGYTNIPVHYHGFPLWLRLMHFFNLFLIFLIIRAGIQILADHPRLYWNVDCTPGTEWFRFQRPVPLGCIWTAKDDAVTLPGWLGIPGLRHSIGLARWWHFSCDLLWVINGAAFYIMLFATTSGSGLYRAHGAVFPNSLTVAIQYLSINFPVNDSSLRFNSLQLLSYFVTIFIAAPLAIITGLMQGAGDRQPARPVRQDFPSAGRAFNPFPCDVLLRFLHLHSCNDDFHHRPARNLDHMFAGVNNNSDAGFYIFGTRGRSRGPLASWSAGSRGSRNGGILTISSARPTSRRISGPTARCRPRTNSTRWRRKILRIMSSASAAWWSIR
jgi:sulfoxide reductase catalytic subunit YedY